MKNIFYILLLLPTIIFAQYPSNSGQKITLGEQTSADGLVYRGNAADTVAATLKITKTNKSDTSAFLLLDTINNVFLKYNIGTTFWTRLNILPTDTASMLGNYWRSGKFSGVLPVANGGTNNTNFTNRGIVFAGSSTQLSNSADIIFNTNGELLINSEDNGIYKLQVGGSSYLGTMTVFGSETIINGNNWYLRPTASNVDFAFNYQGKSGADLIFYSGTTERIRLRDDGRLSINSGNSPTEALDITGNARIRTVGTAENDNAALYVTSTGVLSTNISDVNKKHNIRNLPYGLSTINNLNPVAFEWNETDKTDIGFIAQDIENVIPESVITNWDSELIFRQEKIIPVLVKAIQEQQALIKALEQRLLILENK